MTSASYLAIPRPIESGFDLPPWEGLIPIPSHIPQSDWTRYAIAQIEERLGKVRELRVCVRKKG